MIGGVERIGQKLLFAFDPETAHGLSIAALKAGGGFCRASARDARLEVKAAGLTFPNPLGMAAGYDKNAEVPDALIGLGFGFAEVGTVTPLPQAGNPKPRIFRLTQDHAVINRLGFNNEGHARCIARLQARKGRLGVERFASLASYLTVNISSPNTPGLRALQAREALAELLEAVTEARAVSDAASNKHTPLFLKIAPDLGETELDDVAAQVLAKKVDGVIVSNTTLSRHGLASSHAVEAGGLSGRPLFARSTAVLARMRRRLGPEVVIVGVGGITSAETAAEKIRAGADLVQLYTGMIYSGPALPARIARGLSAIVQREGVASIGALRDTALPKWEAAPI